MFIWYYIELSLMVLLPLIAITQLIVPALRDKPLFPFFRRIFRKKKDVEEKIRELKVAKEVKTLNKTADELERELDLPDDLERLRQKADRGRNLPPEDLEKLDKSKKKRGPKDV